MMNNLPDPRVLGNSFGLVIVGGSLLLALIIALPTLFIVNRQRKAAKQAVLRGIRQQTCRVCNGQLVPGDIIAWQPVYFRQARKNRMVAAARCENCGRLEFFA